MNRLERLGLEVASYQLLGSRTKAATLCALMDAGGRALSPEQIAEARPCMSGDAPVDARNVVKTRICLLRESLEDVGFPNAIWTVEGVGYAIKESVRARIMDRLIEVAA